MRAVSAIIQAEIGNKGFRQFPIQRIAAYAVDSALDTDADQFSIDIEAPHGDFGVLLQRDTEIRVNLFTGARRGVEQLHSGIADSVSFDSDDRIISITGRDYSCVATDTDAAPGKWKHVRPASFIEERAHQLGINNVQVAKCSEIGLVVTDGSEREWALWYRLMREKKMWLWFEPTGRLVGDKLAYDVAATYFFGSPVRGRPSSGWLPVERLEVTKSDSDRLGEVWVYAENPKTNKTFFGHGVDTTITSWKRRPIRILTSTTAKDAAAVKKEADDEIFDSIVGSTEVTLTVKDPGFIIRQNAMAQVNIPEIDFSGLWFVAGVRVRGGAEGFYQEVRLRERGFALPKRVPDAPKLKNDMNDPAANRIPGSVGHVLASIEGQRFGRMFVRATQLFKGGWDFSVFLGVLLSIASHESSFRNVRQKHAGATNDKEWYPQPTQGDVIGTVDPSGHRTTLADVVQFWREAFANDAGNQLNPFKGADAGVGIMQLTSSGYKRWADEYGWDGRSKFGEYDGGRWNPESNIMAGARALSEKLREVHANPNNPDDIWRGVKAYNGSGPAADKYARDVKALYDTQYKAAAEGAVQQAVALPVGSKVNVTANGHTFAFPKDMPQIIAKAINFALRHLGEPYRWGGPGHSGDVLANGHLLYDCSSFVTAALYAGGVRGLDQPSLGHHGESTYTLVVKGTEIPKDNLLAGDLVFFESGPGHVGMYLDDGLFIHDPHTNDVIKISSLGSSWYRDNWHSARRLVVWGGRGVTSGD